MSTARINAWITAVGEPCKIDSQYQWYIHVLHCDGTVLEWCDRTYTNIETKCGHAEFEVPPGQYLVVATWSPGSAPTHLGNHLTHMQIVRVDCGEEACVMLFPPTVHFCGWWVIRALRDLTGVKAVDAGAAREAMNAMERFLGTLDPDPFTEATRFLGPQVEQKRTARRPRKT